MISNEKDKSYRTDSKDDVDALMAAIANDYAGYPGDYFKNLDETNALSIMNSIYEDLGMEASAAYRSNDINVMIDRLDLGNDQVRAVVADKIYKDMW